MKRRSTLLFMIVMLLLCAACGAVQTPKDALETIAPQAAEPDMQTAPVQKTAVQAQKVRYIPIAEVGSYNPEIITKQLLENCTLEDIDKAALPYWTGYILENKISVNCARDGEWARYTGGNWYYNEAEIRYLAENGFNCVRAVYSLSFLSNPEDVNSINVSELEQLDELIAWCAKYNIHLMLSQTGLPGKWGSWGANWHEDYDAWDNEESVRVNTELYTSEEMRKTNAAYWEMLAMRYADIPSGLLSFELSTEGAVPDGDTKLQAEVLGPVAQKIWEYNPSRIIIADDVFSRPPVEMAQLGCCISLHEHIYTLGEMSWCDFPNPQQTWPMQYLPNVVNENAGSLVLEAERAFSAGTLELYYQFYNVLPEVTGDGQVLYQPAFADPVYEPGILSVTIPEGTKRVEVSILGEMGITGFVFKQNGRNTLAVPSHGVYQAQQEDATMPTLLIHDDGTFEDISENRQKLDADFFTSVYLQPFLDCARENGVSFVLTEVGTDSAGQLLPEDYVGYEETWLTALKNNHIGWMFNCVHNVLAPEELLWLNAANSKFTAFSEVPGMYGYLVNDVVMDLLKRFQ